LSVVVSALIGACCFSAFAATECVWVGGASGALHEAANWSEGIVPSSDKDYQYVAVFTNDATVTLTQNWYPIGIVVGNNSQVVVNGSDSCRCIASQKCQDFTLSMDVETGSSLTFDVYVYSQHSRNFVKKGGGLLYPKKYFGNSSSKGSYFTTVDVQGGALRLPGGKVAVSDTLAIRNGSKVTAMGDWPFLAAEYDAYRLSCPKIEIEEGATFDFNGKAVKVSSLSGAGDVVNCSVYLDLELRDSGCFYSGKISGGGQLRIQPNTTWTSRNATWIVGAADTLSGVELKRNRVDGCQYEIQFVPGIETFYAKTVPVDMPSFNTDGKPVEIARSGNFWYVDCKRDGEKGDGKSLETAFQTLREAMENPSLAAGDTVWVDDGEYCDAPMSATQSSVTTYSQVIVPGHVRLISLKGAAETIIVGKSSASPVASGYGCGEGAVRCATLGANAVLRGFTLRDGRVRAASKSDATSANFGGGVFADVSSVVIDCVISNCAACRGGGTYRGSFYNCRFDSNRAIAGDKVGDHIYEEARLYNCLLTRNLGGYIWYANSKSVKAVNCTFGYSSHGSIRSAKNDASSVIFNTLLMAAPESYLPECISNCIVYSSSSAEDGDSVKTSLTATTKPTIYSFAGVDAVTLKPKKHVSRVVLNAADAAGYESQFPASMYWLSQYDADFNRRVWDGKVDIGALSYDRSLPIPGFNLIVR
jgi:hypothetical protein